MKKYNVIASQNGKIEPYFYNIFEIYELSKKVNVSWICIETNHNYQILENNGLWTWDINPDILIKKFNKLFRRDAINAC